METRECLKTDLTSWNIGPYDPALPGPMGMSLLLDGEVVVSAELETGYLHRGIEKTFEKQLWKSAISYSDRVDPEGAVFGELALCLAVEEIANFSVPQRAQDIRVILAELARISAHMGYIVKVAHAVNSETMVHYVLRDREKVLDLLELVAGARFSINFLRFGGVQADVTEGFIERVLEVCEILRVRLKEYNDLFTYNHAFIKRTLGIGILSAERARVFGITGPNARASGLGFDARKVHPHSGYDRLDFEVPLALSTEKTIGDSNDRFLVRLREIAVSIEILRQVAEHIVPGEFLSHKSDDIYCIPAGEAYARVESARGLLGCHVVSDGGSKPHRVQYRVPSVAHLSAVPDLVAGIRLEDLPVVLASMGLGLAEADR